MLGTHELNEKIFLSVAFGKLRQKTIDKKKVTENTPKAVKRTTQAGDDSWAIEYDYIVGQIKNIFYKENRNESKDYGNSYEVVVSDGIENYQLSFKSDSRFWFDFMKKLPNINLENHIKIAPYDFSDKVTGKKRIGVSVEINGEKILSYYDKKEGDTRTLLHGFPPSKDVDWGNKKQIKRFTLDVEEFMDNEFKKLILPKFATMQNDTPEPENVSNEKLKEVEEPDNDLPF